MTLVAIWAQDVNGVIGIEGVSGLPWSCVEDLKHFKAETMGRVCIVGRTTYEGLPKLKGRRFVVLSRQTGGRPVKGKNDDAVIDVVASPEAAFAIACSHDQNPYVIGGKATFTAMWPWVTHITRTTIRTTVINAHPMPTLHMDPVDETVWELHDGDTLSEIAYVCKWFRKEAGEDQEGPLLGDVTVSNSSLHDQIDLEALSFEDRVAEEHQPILAEIVARGLADLRPDDSLYMTSLKDRYHKLLGQHRLLMADPAVGSHLEPQLRALEILIYSGDD